MLTEPHWIAGPWRGRLAVSPRPRGADWLEDEMTAWRSAGVGVVVSLLEPDEACALGLELERRVCESSGMNFRCLPIEDRGVPTPVPVALEFLKEIGSLLAGGTNVIVHCRQGIGRSGLVAAALLVLAGENVERAIELVSLARGVPIPETKEQRNWINVLESSKS